MSAVYSVGIDVALRSHRVAVLGPDGEAVGKSFTIESTAGGFAVLVDTLQARGAAPATSVIGLEATGHLWENLEAHLTRAGYRVVVLNPVQSRRYRDVLRRKAKTDDIDAYVIAGLLRSGQAAASYVPAETIQSLRELARLRARLMRDRQNYLRQLGAQLSVVFPEHPDALAICSPPARAGSSARVPRRTTWRRRRPARSITPPTARGRAALRWRTPRGCGISRAGRHTAAKPRPRAAMSCARS